MLWGRERDSRRADLCQANAHFGRGPLEQLSGFLCPNGRPGNFLVSGGTGERYQCVAPVLDALIGVYPLLVLHNADPIMENLVVQSWERLRGTAGVGPLWVINQRERHFEPLFGMSAVEITAVCRRLAKKMGFAVPARFDRVVRAHLRILEQLEAPASLSELVYLCRFSDMEEFHRNVMALPGTQRTNQQLWADLCADGADPNSPFDLFRTVVEELAREAERSGWSPENSYGAYNCLEAIRQNATLSLSINASETELLLPYILDELKAAQSPFFLLLDGVRLTDGEFLEYLALPGGMHDCGIIAENVVELLGGDKERLSRLAETMKCLILFKHGTGKTAEVLSELLGRYDRTREEVSRGSDRGLFNILPQHIHENVRSSQENRFRVMPEKLMSLKPGQAIVFDTGSNRIIYYNE